MHRTGLAALVAVLALAGCGGTPSVPKIAQDVTGGTASDADTLVKEANFKDALARLGDKAGAGARVITLKIEPRSIKADLSVGGTEKVLAVNKSGDAFAVSLPPTGAGQDSIPLSKVDPAVPEKILAKAHLGLQDVGYFALSVNPISKKGEWGLYPASGSGHWQAALNGGHVKKIG